MSKKKKSITDLLDSDEVALYIDEKNSIVDNKVNVNKQAKPIFMTWFMARSILDGDAKIDGRNVQLQGYVTSTYDADKKQMSYKINPLKDEEGDDTFDDDTLDETNADKNAFEFAEIQRRQEELDAKEQRLNEGLAMLAKWQESQQALVNVEIKTNPSPSEIPPVTSSQGVASASENTTVKGQVNEPGEAKTISIAPPKPEAEKGVRGKQVKITE